MPVSLPPADRPQVWTLTSELEGERASSFRQGRWCRILLEAGFTVVAYNIRGAFGLSRIVFTSTAELDVFQARIKAGVRPMASVREGLLVRLLRPIKHLLLADLWQLNVWRLLILILSAIRSSRAPVVVMASSPPFSVAVVGAVAKALHARHMVFVVDMRDAWALHTGLGGVRSIKRMIERWVLRRADRVLTVSVGLSNEFAKVHGIPSPQVIYNVATHYSSLTPPESRPWSEFSSAITASSIKLVYTGSTPEGHFNLPVIVTGVRQAIARGLSAERIQLVFVGACDALAREVDKQGGCDGVLVFIGHHPHRIAQELQRQADGLVFLAYHGEGNKGVVSTKFFEYLALGLPVLPFGICQGSDVDLLLQRFAGGSLNLLTSDNIAGILLSVSTGVRCLPSCTQPDGLNVLVDDYRAEANNWTRILGAFR
jgi:glycosyltransferase involved in cell wall biosynthesis